MMGRFGKNCLLIALLAQFIPFSNAFGQTVPLPNFNNTSQCETIDLESDDMDCNREQCILDGNVRLSCQDFHLYADHVLVLLKEGFAFNGAQARGNVALIEGSTLVQCQNLTLGQNRIEGKIREAEIQVKHGDALKNPDGRNQAILHGDIQRVAPHHFLINEGDFTLCDCDGTPPSWRLDSSSIEIHTKERATLWWPSFKINAFGLGLIPITPPLAPLSVPLKKRAMGFLAPSIRIMSFPYPTVDIPFFIPLGKSYDLTLSPGMRFDWGSHHLTPVSSWGASRLGARFRYTPSKKIRGNLDVQLTYDRKTYAARLGAAKEVTERDDQLLEDDPAPNSSVVKDYALTWGEYAGMTHEQRIKALKQYDIHKDLIYRTQWNWTQDVFFTHNLHWGTKVKWLSDDLIQDEFGITLEDRKYTYLPSRTQLYFRDSLVSASLSANYYTRLKHKDSEVVHLWNRPKNSASHELQLPQRGPALQLSLQPQMILPGVLVDAQAAFVHYGAWFDNRETLAQIATGNSSIRYVRALGPIQVRASAQGIGHVQEAGDLSANTLGLVADLQLSSLLGRSYSDTFMHTLEPQLKLRSLPWLSNTDWDDYVLGYEESTSLRLFHQAALGLKQTLSTLKGTKRKERLSLTISQPIDLETSKLLPTQLEVKWALPILGRATVQSSIDTTQPTFRTRELYAKLSIPVFDLGTLSARYGKFASNSDRYSRSIYELGSLPPVEDEEPNWTHSVQTGLSLKPLSDFSLSYYGSVLLKRPNEPEPKEGRNPRPYFTKHEITIGYKSPCDCWGFQARAQIIDPESRGTEFEFDPATDLNIFFTLTIADYSVGTR